MYIDFSKLFHRSSKDLTSGENAHIPRDLSQWPEEWITVFYKRYGKLAQILLPNEIPSAQIFDQIAKRRSQRNFKKIPLELSEFSHILKYSCGEIGTSLPSGYPRRAQPSGGARYPIEAYVFVLDSSASLPSGIYHYNVQKHSLDVLWERRFSNDDIKSLFVGEWVFTASAVIVLTSIFSRTTDKYGQLGYRFALLEAGHIGQNVYLTSGALGIGCSITNAYSETLEHVLQIDGEYESIVHSLVLGK